MDTSIGRDRFCEMFEGRAVVIAELPAGRSRVLAHVANQRVGCDDGSLRTRAQYVALFDLLLTHVSPTTPANRKLLDETGRPSAIAWAIEDYIAASTASAPAQAAVLVLAVVAASAGPGRPLTAVGGSMDSGQEGLKERFQLESVNSPSGVTHVTFSRRTQ